MNYLIAIIISFSFATIISIVWVKIIDEANKRNN
jgi:hypothetical protein